MSSKVFINVCTMYNSCSYNFYSCCTAIMDYWTIILFLVIPLLGAFYYYLSTKSNTYWSDRGVAGPPPLPILGNFLEFQRKGQVVLEKEYLAKYGKVYGSYIMLSPILTIVDRELIKQVLVKDFHVFVNRDKLPFDHEIWNSNLFNSEDEQWKRVRTITSPSFTSVKLRGMRALMGKCVDKLVDYFERVTETNDGKINVKEVIMGFTIDVIALTSFATETNANGDRAKQNPFLENGLKLFDLNFFRVVLLVLLPKKLNKLIGNSVGLSDKRFNFFVDLSREIVKQRRRDKSHKRNDLVQLLMDAFVYEDQLEGTDYGSLEDLVEEQPKDVSPKVGSSIKRTLTENEIIAQCIVFFGAGFETTGTSLSNCLYNLAINPLVQELLFEELNIALGFCDPNSEKYYEIVMHKIPYLDAVIKETLRMNPPLVRLQRRVGIDGYSLAGIPLEKDLEVNICTLAVHYCAEYYPEPERFDPERFMPENKHRLLPYTFLPFGEGPRSCIGMRFAQQEMKLCLAQIVRQFRFEPTEQTKIPLDYLKIGFMTCRNIPLRVVKR